MTLPDAIEDFDPAGFLGPDDPAPVEVLNPEGASPVLLLCDHAGRGVPAHLGNLGLDDAVLARHIGWDIGAAECTHWLAHRLDAKAVLSSYSRLVIDCNRELEDPTSICQISDGTTVPGNAALDDADRAQRAEALHAAYHRAVDAAVDGFLARGAEPIVVSIHSFTPVLRGIERPWPIGVLYAADDRIAQPLLQALADDPDLTVGDKLMVGDNQPYDMRNAHGYTLEYHALPRGLPNVLIEFRQDLIDTPAGVEKWSTILHRALETVLADPRWAGLGEPATARP